MSEWLDKNDFYGVRYKDKTICNKCKNFVREGCRYPQEVGYRRGTPSGFSEACVQYSRQYMDNFIKHRKEHG